MARNDLCVQKVTIEYVIGGKSFTVELDPMKVGSIFFSKLDKDEAVARQKTRTKKDPVQHVFAASDRIPAEVERHRSHAKTVKVGAAPELRGPSLWWHTNSCVWFHPED